MARRPAARPVPEVRRLSPDDIRRGIARLEKRLDDVKALDPARVPYDDQRVDNAERNIKAAVLEIYGPHSPQYKDNEFIEIWEGGKHMGMRPEYMQRCFAAGVPKAITLVEGLIADLRERLAEHELDPTERVRAAFTDLSLHPRIAAVASELYRNGHYRNAVLDSCIALMNYVKEKSRRHDLDGAALMRTVFSRRSPVLTFNDLGDQSDEDEQEGLMHLFEGAMLAFRNPRAHDVVSDDAEGALECIAFLSMLAKRVDAAHRVDS